MAVNGQKGLASGREKLDQPHTTNFWTCYCNRAVPVKARWFGTWTTMCVCLCYLAFRVLIIDHITTDVFNLTYGTVIIGSFYV